MSPDFLHLNYQVGKVTRLTGYTSSTKEYLVAEHFALEDKP